MRANSGKALQGSARRQGQKLRSVHHRPREGLVFMMAEADLNGKLLIPEL
jgi:hypothetical protein